MSLVDVNDGTCIELDKGESSSGGGGGGGGGMRL
jgi:hypothetical protein